MNHRTLAILAALCAIAPAANAEETLTLGAVGNYRSSAYRAYDDSWAALPYIHYNGTHIYINGSSAGVKLYRSDDESQEILLGLDYPEQHYKPGKSNDPQLRQLNQRRRSLDATLQYHLYTPYGHIYGGVAHDISGHSKGSQITAAYSYPWQLSEQITLSPSIGATYRDHKHNRYYYGISAAEAATSGLATYDAKAGITPHLGLGARIRLTPQLSAVADLRVEHLDKAAADSPMNERKTEYQGSVGVVYQFNRRPK